MSNPQSEKKEHEFNVQVRSLKTNEKAHFKASPSTTVSHVWDRAISEEFMGEPKAPGDTFRCAGGADMTPHLSKTLAEVDSAGLCKNMHFEIRGPSGGATSA